MLEALIPYIQTPEYTLARQLPFLGTLKLQVFGPLVALGVYLGILRCLAYAKARDIDEGIARDVMFWALISGFVISHWVSVIFYFPEKVAQDPIVLLQIWNGLSSVGGLFGFMVGVFWFLHKKKQPFLIYCDMLCFGMLVGFTTGRLGCSLVHDHPGLILEGEHALSFLAVSGWKGNPAITRWDLGLLEFIYLVPLALYMHLGFNWREARPGKLLGVTALLYAPYRLFLDNFRVEDKQYLGLTTAQYFVIIAVVIGVYLVFLRKPRPADLEWARESAFQAEEAARKAAEAGEANKKKGEAAGEANKAAEPAGEAKSEDAAKPAGE